MPNVINYTGIDQVKDYFMKQIAPNYFNVEDINDLNVGLLGYTTEVGATTTEDTFNAISLYVKEAFPNLAQLPESLYNFAANLDISDLFASPSRLSMFLLIKEKDIIEKGTVATTNNHVSFVIDKLIRIDVDGIPFSPDYDIIIGAQPFRDDFIFTAQYDMKYQNSISSEKIPYLKTTRITQDNERYLGILIPNTHQVERKVQVETIIDNDVINNTSIMVDYSDELAGFDVFYRPPGEPEYVALTKKVFGGTPIKTPFCFYKLKDKGLYEITFTMMDGYFQPEFGSEIQIITYTTKGVSGNFIEYVGGNITATPQSDKYDYNNNTIMYAIPQGESIGGQSAMGLEALRNVIVSRWATSGAYNNENDLQLYIENYTDRDKTDVFFVKKRDDLVERLFSSFALFKNRMGDFYPTNTLYLKIFEEDFDSTFQQDGRSTIHAGAVFGYDQDSKTTGLRLKGKTVNDKFPKGEFAYTNPFVISVQKSPSIVGYYLNSINRKVTLDYTHVNIDSYYQFIANAITVTRNSMKGDNNYTIKGSFIPASPLPKSILEVPEGSPPDTKPEVYDRIKIVVSIMEGSNDICYQEMTIDSIDEETGVLFCSTTFESKDTITQDERILFANIKDPDDNTTVSRVVPMIDCVLNFYTLYKYDEPQKPNDPTIFKIKGFDAYTLTNRYSTTSDPINFMLPLNIIRSKSKFVPYVKQTPEGPVDSYFYEIELVPLIKHDAINEADRFDEFLESIQKVYTYLSNILSELTTNYNIDMKFYNTYGRSSNFTVGPNDDPLDRVNVSIHFKITPRIGITTEDLVPRLKQFIKEYIERANILIDDGSSAKGYNAIYISNLMRLIETTFNVEISHHQFVRINGYDSSIQVIENKTTDLNELSQSDRRSYVPEYLSIDINDITIEVVYK